MMNELKNNKFYLNYLSLNEKINYKNTLYLWDNGKACKHFNKSVRSFLDYDYDNRDKYNKEQFEIRLEKLV